MSALGDIDAKAAPAHRPKKVPDERKVSETPSPLADWTDVGRVLLGSWPSQVAGWGREAIAAYVAELQARSITPDGAIYALRSSESKFPPSAGELQRIARRRRDADALRALLGGLV